jgi:hypothetical protein
MTKDTGKPPSSGLTRVHQHNLAFPVENWIKKVISKIKSTDVSDKNELKRLNAEFKSYPDHVKELENFNRKLLKDVEDARFRATPTIMDKAEHDKRLEELRFKLGQQSKQTVATHASIDDHTKLIQHYSQLIRFVVDESEMQTQKISVLQNNLKDLKAQRETLTQSFKAKEEEAKKEKVSS